MKKYFKVLIGAAFLLTAGCSSGGVPRTDLEDTNAQGQGLSVLSLPMVADFQGPGQGIAGDRPALALFDEVANRKASAPGVSADSVVMGVYSLQPEQSASDDAIRQRLSTLAARHGLNKSEATRAKVTSAGDHGVSQLGNWRLAIVRETGVERFWDTEAFHAVSPTTGAAKEDELIAAAQDYVTRTRPSAAQGAQTYAYKTRRYMNAVSGPGQASKAKVTKTSHYQSAVSFNQSIDGLPVIGPGAKAVVHMTPDARRVVAHEYSLSRVGNRLGSVRLSDLRAPGDARAEVESKLTERGIDLSSYELERSEAGYFSRGRNSKQTVLAPHYAFVYTPKDMDSGLKRLIEVVPAVDTPELRSLIDADAARDEARKVAAREGITPDSRNED